MGGNRWDQPGVPHKGWHCVDGIDLRSDGGSANETDYATCQMCGNEKIRYVYIMDTADLDENLYVGCVDCQQQGPASMSLRSRADSKRPATPA